MDSIGHGDRMEHPDSIRAIDLVVALRCILGVPPFRHSPVFDMPAHVPVDLVVRGVNQSWLIAWMIGGLHLFDGCEMPTMAAAIIAAKRTVANLAMDEQAGKVTSAARLLRTGRPNIRRTLEEAGCFPWVDPIDRHPPIAPVPWCRCAAADENAA